MLRRLKKPAIAITIGDPCGIGPEITVKALAHPEVLEWCRPVVVGSQKVLEQAAKLCGVPMPDEGRVTLVDIPNGFDYQSGPTKADSLQPGVICAGGGQAAYEAIEKATELCLQGKVDAMVTAPIHKQALKLAGVPYIGHTEILAGLTETEDPLTMFYVHGMKVFFLTRHIAFADIVRCCTKDRIYTYIHRCVKALEQMGITPTKEQPFAVAALNPHGSDNGLFGTEEADEVLPAIQQAQAEGIAVTGPHPADSVFHMALQGKFSGVLSLYHDQGHIATKTLDFERTIAVTCGLPFLRTSVDHGTAFDIAGTGRASEVSMVEAIRVAAEMMKNR